MKKIISVVGARPNFMKVAPIDRVLRTFPDEIQHMICHTGQHFDKKMSDVFFEDLEMPRPHFHLGISGGSHAEQTARIMMEFEKIVLEEKPDLVLVVGDVNSTLACSIVASKLHVKVAHVEAGLRSFDREMPEEINRMITDAISDYLFVTEKSGLVNLGNEGVNNDKIFFCGNVMIDSLANFLPKIEKSTLCQDMGLEIGKYVLMTFHRPSNVDDIVFLRRLVTMLNEVSAQRKVVFPIHPRTKNKLAEHGLSDQLHENVILLDPQGYIDFQSLVKNAELIVTDSGGIQEESTYLGVACLTVRENTERPVTITQGTNQLVGTDLDYVQTKIDEVLSGQVKDGGVPPLWDGKAANRIVNHLRELL